MAATRFLFNSKKYIIMACTLVSSFAIPCRDSNGGVQEMKIKVFNSAAVNTTIVESSGTVTFSGASLTNWYTYACEKQTAFINDNGATSIENGTTVYTQIVNYIWNKLQVAFRNEVKTLGQVRVHIAVKDVNGTAWLFGFTRGMDLLSSANGSGTNQTDRSGYVLTFQGMEPNPIVAISNYDSLITA